LIPSNVTRLKLVPNKANLRNLIPGLLVVASDGIIVAT